MFVTQVYVTQSFVMHVVAEATTADTSDRDSCVYVPADIVMKQDVDKEKSNAGHTYLNISTVEASKFSSVQCLSNKAGSWKLD